MLSLEFLTALQIGFWPVYVGAMVLATVVGFRQRSWCKVRVVAALLLASVVQMLWEGTGYLTWEQHLIIDVPVLVALTSPPRHHWQAVIAAFVFAQIVLHVVWGVAEGYPGIARFHWLGCTILGYSKCISLALWSGGPRVQTILDRFASSLAHLVLAPLGRKLAQ